MSTMTEQDVRHVAKLARLKLRDEELQHLTLQLGKVLDYVARLQALDVEGVEPMAHPTEIVNKLRPDVPGPTLDVAAALANAPDRDEPYFKVPKVIGDGGGA